MDILKWLLGLVAAVLGAAGIGMSLCGGWFVIQDINSMLSKPSGYESVVAVVAISSIALGAGLLFLARYLFKKADGFDKTR